MDNPHIVPFAIMAQAQATAAEIYADIGVKLKWRSRPATKIWIPFDTDVLPEVYPGAMGYARPYGETGASIHIMLDRVLRYASQKLTAALLGHVMAHELGHVLQGLSRHSDSGLMKAGWDRRDYDQMLVRPLSFSSEDSELIQNGLARRAALNPKRGETSE